jgi:hypothetical protein
MSGKEEILKALESQRSTSKTAKKSNKARSVSELVRLYGKGQMTDGRWAAVRALKVTKGLVRATEGALPMDDETVAEIAGPFVEAFEALYFEVADAVIAKAQISGTTPSVPAEAEKDVANSDRKAELKAELKAVRADKSLGKTAKAAKVKALQDEILSL